MLMMMMFWMVRVLWLYNNIILRICLGFEC